MILEDNRWSPERSAKTVLLGVDGRMRSFIGGTMTLEHQVQLFNRDYTTFKVRYHVLHFPKEPSRFRTLWGIPMILAHDLRFEMREETVTVTLPTPARTSPYTVYQPFKRQKREKPAEETALCATSMPSSIEQASMENKATAILNAIESQEPCKQGKEAQNEGNAERSSDADNQA